MSAFIIGDVVQYNTNGGVNSSKENLPDVLFEQFFLDGRTIDAGTITLYSIQLQFGQQISFEVTFNGKANNTTNSIEGKVYSCFRKESAVPGFGVVRLGPVSGDGFIREDFVGIAPGITFTNVGDVVFVTAQGTAGNDVFWFAEVKAFFNEQT